MDEMYLYYFTNEESLPFFIQYGSHEGEMNTHRHVDFWELVIVLSGTATHEVDGEEYVVSRGDVFVINSKIGHGYKNANNFKICNIMFRPNIFNSARGYIGTLSGFHALFVIEPFLTESGGFKSRLRLSVEEYDKIKSLIQSMIGEYSAKRAGWQTSIKSLFMIMSVELSRIYSFENIHEKESAIYIAKPIAYIEEHFKEQISLNELANMVNISPRHFTRLFSETYSMTPIKYINLLRLNSACRLLKSTTMNISEISYASGFSDSNYFSRVFRKKFGKTPLEYRRSNADKGNSIGIL
ncbi:MAG: helix-turn-helix domain-containing protein [Clostridiales bacterium]|nr:helix-turn-helix domain-containing protein [Clostridiales bacterium]